MSSVLFKIGVSMVALSAAGAVLAWWFLWYREEAAKSVPAHQHQQNKQSMEDDEEMKMEVDLETGVVVAADAIAVADTADVIVVEDNDHKTRTTTIMEIPTTSTSKNDATDPTSSQFIPTVPGEDATESVDPSLDKGASVVAEALVKEAPEVEEPKQPCQDENDGTEPKPQLAVEMGQHKEAKNETKETKKEVKQETRKEVKKETKKEVKKETKIETKQKETTKKETKEEGKKKDVECHETEVGTESKPKVAVGMQLKDNKKNNTKEESKQGGKQMKENQKEKDLRYHAGQVGTESKPQLAVGAGQEGEEKKNMKEKDVNRNAGAMGTGSKSQMSVGMAQGEKKNKMKDDNTKKAKEVNRVGQVGTESKPQLAVGTGQELEGNKKLEEKKRQENKNKVENNKKEVNKKEGNNKNKEDSNKEANEKEDVECHAKNSVTASKSKLAVETGQEEKKEEEGDARFPDEEQGKMTHIPETSETQDAVASSKIEDSRKLKINRTPGNIPNETLEDEEFHRKLKVAIAARAAAQKEEEDDEDDDRDLFDKLDEDGDGKLSRIDVEKAIFRRKTKKLNLKPTIVLRAFQESTKSRTIDRIPDGDGALFISREQFVVFLRTISYFSNLYSIFDTMDINDNRRLSQKEFTAAAALLGVVVEEPEAAFREMDEHSLGYIVFDDFCLWMACRQANMGMDGKSLQDSKDKSLGLPEGDDISSMAVMEAKTPEEFEQRLKNVLEAPNGDEIQVMFDKIDKSGEGQVSTSDIERAICHGGEKPILVGRGIHLADIHGDGNITRDEFDPFLRRLLYFQSLHNVFSPTNTDPDRHFVTREEFLKVAPLLGVAEGPEAIFDEMDEHSLGYVVFDNFCLRMASRSGLYP